MTGIYLQINMKRKVQLYSIAAKDYWKYQEVDSPSPDKLESKST